jgi:hypothetical protein
MNRMRPLWYYTNFVDPIGNLSWGIPIHSYAAGLGFPTQSCVQTQDEQ